MNENIKILSLEESAKLLAELNFLRLEKLKALEEVNVKEDIFIHKEMCWVLEDKECVDLFFVNFD